MQVKRSKREIRTVKQLESTTAQWPILWYYYWYILLLISSIAISGHLAGTENSEFFGTPSSIFGSLIFYSNGLDWFS